MLTLRRVLRLAQTSTLRLASSQKSLKECLRNEIDAHRKLVIQFRKSHGKKKVCEVTVNQIYGGMRGVTAMISETSGVDALKGVMIRGKDLPELQQILPIGCNGNQPLAEGVYWFLLTGKVPTKEQIDILVKDFQCRRVGLPKSVQKFIKHFEGDIPPIKLLSAAITLWSTESFFQKSYKKGKIKDRLWECAYEDSMLILANLPELAALVYYKIYYGHTDLPPSESEDIGALYAELLGFNDSVARDLMRLHMLTHCDHSIGNVSAHTSHLVGSSLADPFLSFSAGLNGLAGPLHGEASQNNVIFIVHLMELYGETPTDEEIISHIKGMLKKRQVVPGFGHAVLRVTDPRFLQIRQFALENFPDDPHVKVVEQLFRLVPPLLKNKARNPYPNIDGYSGVAWKHVGMHHLEYNTVLFAVSRALGILAQYIWSRALLLPIERPKSLSTENLIKFIQKTYPDAK